MGDVKNTIAQAEICVSFATDHKSLVSSPATHHSTCSREAVYVSLASPSPNKVTVEWWYNLLQKRTLMRNNYLLLSVLSVYHQTLKQVASQT